MKQNLLSVWKGWVIMCVVIASHLPSYSQYSESSSFSEIGISMGPSNFLGDLGGGSGIGLHGITSLKDNNWSVTKFMIGAYYVYQPNEWLGVRLMANFGRLEGDDAIIKGKGGFEEARKIRNQDFRSKLIEGFIAVEVYPTVLFEYEPTDIYHKLRPYGFLGVGAFHFNPQGTDPRTGQWVDLKPLHTEGQGFPEYPDRKEYKLTQLNIPMGLGVKYFLSEKVSLALEYQYRHTFTDYIDDTKTTYIDPSLFYAHMPLAQAQIAERVANKSIGPTGVLGTRYAPGSKRGTETHNDAYYSFGFKIGIRLSREPWSTAGTRCPVRF